MDDFDLYRLDGHTLRIFSSVCQTMSVSRTAQLFDLNQSTISHTIDKMRSAIGDPLFVKSGRGIIPTEKALILFPRVQNILTQIEGLVAPEIYDASIDSRPITIAIPTPALLKDMRALHSKLLTAAPNSRLEIRRLAPRKRIIELMIEEDTDLAIAVSGDRYPATLNHCKYGFDRLAIFYDPNYRDEIATLEDYGKANHAVVDYGGGAKSILEQALMQSGQKRIISLVAPTASMLGDLISGTDIIATMPERLSNSVFRGLAKCEPPIQLPTIDYDLVWHRKYEYSGRNSWLRKTTMELSKLFYEM